MVKLLVALSIVWPLTLAAAVWQRQSGEPASWTTAVYVASGLVCHQRSERSFATGGVQWPVCGRCSGLYLAAPFGAALAILRRRRRRTDAVRLLAVAALPTVATLVLEWGHLATVTNAMRAAAALPLGAAVAAAIVGVAAEPRRTIGYTGGS